MKCPKTITSFINRVSNILLFLSIVIMLVSCVTSYEKDISDRLQNLIDQLESGDVKVRRHAALRLGGIGAQASPAVKELINFLSDDDHIVRYRVILALGYIGPNSASAVPHLIKILNNENESLKYAAATALGDIGPASSSAAPDLVETLINEDPSIKKVSIEALGNIGPPSVSTVNAIATALNDERIAITKSAAEALGKFGPKAAIAAEALAQKLGDNRKGDRWSYSKDTVHDKVYEVLVKLGTLAIPGWMVALNNPNEDVKLLSIKILAKFGPKARIAIPSLIRSSLDSNDNIRKSSEKAIEKISIAAKTLKLTRVDILTMALRDDDPNVRKLALEGLAQLGNIASSSTKQIIKTLNDPNIDVQITAALTLGELGSGNISAIIALTEALDDENEDVRYAAAKAIEKIDPQKRFVIKNEKYFTKKKELNLSYELERAEKEKRTLQKQLASEIDLKNQLQIALKEQKVAHEKQQKMFANLYERERQLKSKLFQLEQANKKSKEAQINIERLKKRAEDVSKKVSKGKEIAKEELSKINLEKAKLEIVAENLKKKETILNQDILTLSLKADKAKQEAENAKSALRAKQKREEELSRQVAKLRYRLNKGMAPFLVITNPKHDSKIQSPTTMLYLIAIDDRGINKINLSLNGESLKLSDARGIVLGTVDKVNIRKRFDIKERLLLQYGRNTIEVSVTDTDGMSQKEIINIIREKELGDIWAVVIGINQYKNKRNLKYAVNDAKAFKNYLTEYIGVLEENMFFLTDQNATRENIQSLLGTQLRRKASKDDTVIIFYAGHGAAEIDPSNPDGDGFEKYLLPYDAKLDDLYSTAIAMREIQNIFQRIRSERLIFIADTCYSGASGGRTMLASAARASLSEKFFERISKSKGRVIISSSSANEVSKEDDKLKHGIFSYYLLEGLKGKADNDSDGIITIAELFGYLSQKVPEASGQDQHPVRKGEIEGELVIGRVK